MEELLMKNGNVNAMAVTEALNDLDLLSRDDRHQTLLEARVTKLNIAFRIYTEAYEFDDGTIITRDVDNGVWETHPNLTEVFRQDIQIIQ